MMKTVKLILMIVVMLSTVCMVNAQKKGLKTVVFKADVHCGNCKAKLEKNIPYEKGVKDMKVDMDKQTVTITFREDKNSVENLQKAIEKLDVAVKSASLGTEGQACPKKGECCGQEKQGEKKCGKSCCEKK